MGNILCVLDTILAKINISKAGKNNACWRVATGCNVGVNDLKCNSWDECGDDVSVLVTLFA